MQDELLPQPVRVLAGELAGDGVEAPHALHGDEERLVPAGTGALEFGDLVPQVILELVDVGRGDGPVALEVGAPLPDLRLHVTLLVRSHGRHTPQARRLAGGTSRAAVSRHAA